MTITTIPSNTVGSPVHLYLAVASYSLWQLRTVSPLVLRVDQCCAQPCPCLGHSSCHKIGCSKRRGRSIHPVKLLLHIYPATCLQHPAGGHGRSPTHHQA